MLSFFLFLVHFFVFISNFSHKSILNYRFSIVAIAEMFRKFDSLPKSQRNAPSPIQTQLFTAQAMLVVQTFVFHRFSLLFVVEANLSPFEKKNIECCNRPKLKVINHFYTANARFFFSPLPHHPVDFHP